eukprot:1859470-Pyramimonas_sp.AAC.1
MNRNWCWALCPLFPYQPSLVPKDPAGAEGPVHSGSQKREPGMPMFIQAARGDSLSAPIQTAVLVLHNSPNTIASIDKYPLGNT